MDLGVYQHSGVKGIYYLLSTYLYDVNILSTNLVLLISNGTQPVPETSYQEVTSWSLSFFMAYFFLPSAFQKRLLRYALSRLEVLDTDALDLENLDIAWGKRSIIELREVGLRLKVRVRSTFLA